MTTTMMRSLRCTHRGVYSRTALASSHSAVPLIHQRGFAKRIIADGFTVTKARKRGKSAGDASGAADGAAAGGVRSGDSLAALDAENELRLQPYAVEIMKWKPDQSQSAAQPDAETAAFDKQCRDRLARRRLIQNEAISHKIRRRWEALNELPHNIRALCLLEDRTPLPANFPVPKNCWGETIIPPQSGLRGKQLVTPAQVKKILHWEQQQRDKQRL